MWKLVDALSLRPIILYLYQEQPTIYYLKSKTQHFFHKLSLRPFNELYDFLYTLFTDMSVWWFVVYILGVTAQVFGESVDGERVTNEVVLTFTVDDYKGTSASVCMGV